MIEFMGEAASLTTALCWSVGSVIFYLKLIPQQVNIFYFNLIRFFLVMCCLGLFLGKRISLSAEISLTELGFLFLIGISQSIAGTFGLYSVKYFKPRRSSLLFTLTAPGSALAASLVLDESLSITIWTGIILTISGVAWAIAEKVREVEIKIDQPLEAFTIIVLTLSFRVIGSLLQRFFWMHYHVPQLEAVFFVNVGAFCFFLTCILVLRLPKSELVKPFKSQKCFNLILLLAFLLNGLPFWLLQNAYKLTEAGIVSTLVSTQSLFNLLLIFWTKEKISFQTVVGTIISVIGVGLIFIY